jgi:16S rRNA (uracil1498-N3)-methyltransferase
VVKGESFDLALRMASELGVGRVVPLWTARAVVRPARSANKNERWARVAREAAKQCGRAEPLVVAPPCELADFLKACGDEDAPAARWIAVPAARRRSDWLDSFVDSDTGDLVPATFLVGPEGGFTPAEVERAIDAGFQPLGFPTPVLRTPTAVALIGALGVVVSSRGA